MTRIKGILSAILTRMRPLLGWWGSVGSRVAFFMSVALFLVAVFVGAFFFREGKIALDAEIKNRALYTARHLATLTVDDIITQNTYEIYKKILPAFIAYDGVISDQDLLYVLVYNRDGGLMVGRTPTEIISAVESPSLPGSSSQDRPPVERALNAAARQLRGPTFSLSERGIYDLTFPVFVAGQKAGFVRIGISGKWQAEQFSSLLKKGIIALGITFLLGLVFSRIIAERITRPILKLSAAAEALSRQNWKTPIPVRGKDEISRLGRTFNQMALTLKQREASLSQGNRDLFILHTAGLDLMESLDIDMLLPKIAERAEDLVRADTTAISVVDSHERKLRYLGVFGGRAQALKDLDMVMESGGIYNWTVSYGTPLLILDARSDFRLDRELMSSLGIRSLMAVPLWSSNRMTGLLSAINKKGEASFNRQDLRLFTVYSNLVSAALQNAQLYSDLKSNMNELGQAQEQLVRSTKMAAIGELAANVAHEINNPLTSVLGYTTHLLKTLEMPEEPRKVLGVMEQETLRVRKIIRNLLDFARQRPSWMRPADVLQPLRETLALVQGVAEASAVRIREDFDGIPILITMDPNEIKQVFINIVNNALQAMPQGGELKIRANVDRQGEAVIEFSDTGVGIPEEDRKKIFEPFFSTKGEGRGTGLGLSISERIIHNHSGRIEVESAAGQGTTFRVVLPRVQAAAPEVGP
jgi:signal transduction histidine kinase/HAMP domain-containing protein